MQSLFECKVRYQKIDEQSGKEKKVTETYLFDAISFTEAESRIYKEMETMIRGDFQVTNIRKAGYSEILAFDEGGDRWFKCKVSFTAIDENAGKEKKVSNQILVLANDVKEAFDHIHRSMNGSTVEFSIHAIMESPVLDFFPYVTNEGDSDAGATDAVPDEA